MVRVLIIRTVQKYERMYDNLLPLNAKIVYPIYAQLHGVHAVCPGDTNFRLVGNQIRTSYIKRFAADATESSINGQSTKSSTPPAPYFRERSSKIFRVILINTFNSPA